MGRQRKPHSRSRPFLFGLAGLLAGLLAATGAEAFSIEYRADRPAELKACDALRYKGQDAEANACYERLLGQNGDPRILAEAARAVGDLKSANADFQAAVKQYPNDPAVHTRWGWLFLDTHQADEAVKLFLESLKLDPKYVPAKLGLASVSADRFEDKARQWVKEVLDAEPENIQALVLRARMDLEEGNLGEADRGLTKARGIVERKGLPPLEVFALLASEDLLKDVQPSPGQDDPWVDRALAYDPHYGQVYETEAHFYVITRRYRKAIALLEKAVALQPSLASAHAELGVNLLRENEIDEAQQQLELAYRGDPYSPETVNTLRLIDSYDHFTVTRSEPKQGEAGPTIITRLQKSEAPVLQPYVLALARKAIGEYTELFGFKLKEPVVVELYPNPDDFAVRTSGLPGIGLLGVTFGYLVAMDSPSGKPPGEFHWGTTLWHELAHVFTLEMTNHLVPRWFSEGISVYEEWSTGPLPGRHMPLPWFQALKDGKLLPVAKLDQGFIRPSYEAQVIVSYMQAGLVCEYVHGRWGQQGIRDMLAAYTDGLDTPAAIKRALGISDKDFDAAFEKYVQAQFGTVLKNLADWQKTLTAANAEAQKNQWRPALVQADKAITLFPNYVDQGSAYLVQARANLELGLKAHALSALEQYKRLGGYDPDALRQLADMLYAAGRRDDAIGALRALLLVAPLNEKLHADLGDWLLDSHQPKEALAEYEAYAAMNPQDQAAVHYRLARAYLGLGDHDRGRKQLLYALEIAPNYRDAQKLLLEMVREH
ncbi:MAG TPA: tetratricopeptide repeat protein [Gammaproteobacteria bacterium]|nr:tetratricopeptide repeat protein [Gammaproteobacteria bacterium]